MRVEVDPDQIQADWSYYHSTDEIEKQLFDIEKNCDGKIKMVTVYKIGLIE